MCSSHLMQTHCVGPERQKGAIQMGRPLKKDVYGTNVLGTPVGSNAGIIVHFHDGASVITDGFLVKQRGARTFIVASLANPEVRYTCRLSETLTGAGQMKMIGYNGQEGVVTNEVAIARITKRLVIDFTGRAYKWRLDNDSSVDYIGLTPVA